MVGLSLVCGHVGPKFTRAGVPIACTYTRPHARTHALPYSLSAYGPASWDALAKPRLAFVRTSCAGPRSGLCF